MTPSILSSVRLEPANTSPEQCLSIWNQPLSVRNPSARDPSSSLDPVYMSARLMKDAYYGRNREGKGLFRVSFRYACVIKVAFHIEIHNKLSFLFSPHVNMVTSVRKVNALQLHKSGGTTC